MPPYLNISSVMNVISNPINESVTPIKETDSKAIVCSSVKGGVSPVREAISYDVNNRLHVVK